MNYHNEEGIKQLKANSSWYLALGIGLVALGTLAVIFSFISTEVLVIYLGALLLTVGVFELIKCFAISKWGNFFLHLVLGILYIIAGGFIIYNPLINAVTLTLFLAIFFIVSGLARIIFAFTNKKFHHRNWILLNGLLTLLLGILIFVQWPASGLWVLGTLIGIDIIFTGWTWIVLALNVKRIKE